jgi:hypothetical protein
MNSKKTNSLVLLILISIQLLGQNQSRIFDFPIKPGTEEWANLKNYSDRLGAYNIPVDLLKNMNTHDLVLTCLDYPEFRLIMTRNSLQLGYDYLKTIFNGFEELEHRSDAAVVLINEFKLLIPEDISTFDNLIEQGRFAMKFTYLGILLAQKSILSNAGYETKKNIVNTMTANYESIEKLPEFYGLFGLTTSTLVLGRLLDIDNYQEFVNDKSMNSKIIDFVDCTTHYDKNIFSKIITLSRDYLSQLTK